MSAMMKTFTLLAVLPALALGFSQEDYDNGSVHMKIMNAKEVDTTCQISNVIID